MAWGKRMPLAKCRAVAGRENPYFSCSYMKNCASSHISKGINKMPALHLDRSGLLLLEGHLEEVAQGSKLLYGLLLPSDF